MRRETERQGWKMGEVAQAIGVSRTTLWRFFAGRGELKDEPLGLLLTCIGVVVLVENGEVTLVRRRN